jgi:hypothetical protein
VGFDNNYNINNFLDSQGDIVVVAYDPGRFLTSQEVGLVNLYKIEYFTLGQEIVDKTSFKQFHDLKTKIVPVL